MIIWTRCSSTPAPQSKTSISDTDPAEDALTLANAAVAQSVQRVAEQQHAVNTWEAAFDGTAEERARLTNAVSATWQATLETARHVLAVEHASPQIEHDVGLEL